MSEHEMDKRASTTAVITCLMRGLHSRLDRPALIDDTWADRLVTSQERERLAAMMGGGAAGSADEVLHAVWKNMPVYGGVVIRTRYTEERVREAVERGVRQYVIVGAGFDSFGVRRPAFARELEVFEVDHGASQALKRERLAASGVEPPGTLHFVGADLSREGLGEALARSGFRAEEPAIFSWLGVTVYLTREANMATLRAIGAFAAAGSELVFTYIEERALHSGTPAIERAKRVAAGLGEPWLSGFESARLGEELRGVGLELIEDVGPWELSERYCVGRTDGLTLGKAGRIAWCRVVGR